MRFFQRATPSLAPPGAVIDYNSPDNIGWQLIVPSFVTLAVALVGILGRYLNKILVVRAKPGLDDWFSLIALIFAIGRVTCNCWEVYMAGVGRHVWDVRKIYYVSILNVYEIGNVLYLFGIVFAKLSILSLYLSIFGKAHVYFARLCYLVGFVVVGYGVGCALSILFACQPEAATWNRSINNTCIDFIRLDITIGALNLLTDLTMFIMPLPVLMRLHTNRKRKLELLAVFGTGLIVVAATIVRIVIVVQTLHDADQTRVIIPDMTWLTVELNIGIFCGCLPLLRGLVRKIGDSKAYSSVHRAALQITPRSVSGSGGRAGRGGSKTLQVDTQESDLTPAWEYSKDKSTVTTSVHA